MSLTSICPNISGHAFLKEGEKCSRCCWTFNAEQELQRVVSEIRNKEKAMVPQSSHVFHAPCGRYVSRSNGFDADGACRVCKHSHEPEPSRTPAWLRLLMLLRLVRRREIRSPDGTLYLTRYCIFGWLPGDKPKRVSLYLHQFHAADGDRHLHTHPWTWARSWLLKGFYKENRLRIPTATGLLGMDVFTGMAYRKAGILFRGDLILATFDFIRLPFRTIFGVSLGPEIAHRVTEVRPGTWSLVLTGPKNPGGWGFLVPGTGYVPWKQYLGEE